MKSLVCLFFISLSLSSFSSTLEGTVTFKDKSATGVLYIFAKKHDGSMPMPLAVKRIVTPKFPVKFTLSAKDAMMEGIPFKGPFKVMARLSKSGNAMDKSGPQAETTESIKLGTKGITLTLK